MAENFKTFPLHALSGIKKDGTPTEGSYWNSGQWVRFYRGLPRSMGGYRSMTNAYPGPSRGLFVSLNGTGYLDIFSGSASALTVGQFTVEGFGGGVTDVTPADFVANPANVWQMSSFYNADGGGEIDLISHAAQNLVDISSNVAAPVFYGDITAATPPSASQAEAGGDFEVSGGILALSPYVIAYGSLGLVAWSDINNPALFPTANAANPTSTKIIKGLSIRGGASSPACLLWSLDSIILMSFIGGDAVWNFQVLSDQSSILSSSCPVEMDGIYYWIGVDRFLTYNGVLRELPNDMNLDFFFSNLNFAQRQKVFGYKNPHWGEICWCVPLFGATECNWMIVYNVREETWSDTPLPSDGRSAAYFAQSWQYPVLAGATPYVDGNFQMYQSEFGTDEIVGNNVNAIKSFVESPDISIVGGGLSTGGTGEVSPDNCFTQLVHFEGDFTLGNSLNVYITGRNFAMDTQKTLDTRVITQADNNFDTQSQDRYIRYIFESNQQGGYFITGYPQISYRPGDRNMI